MKRLAILALLLAGCAAHVTPPTPVDWTITPQFNYDFTNYQICSATVTTGCVSGFTWGYLNGTTQVPLKTSATTICTGTTQPEACTDSQNAQLPIGSLTFYVEANYLSLAGTASSSPVDSTTSPVNVPAGTPTGLSVTIK